MSGKLSIAAVLSALSAVVTAQRPASTSICDYYTTALLTDNTPANQYTLLTLLVNTAVIGNYTTPNVGIAVPGLLSPTTYNGEAVNLLPYFSGCLVSTNVQNHPSSVNFLDGGGADALKQNLPSNNPNSAQYFLLTHLYQFFGKLLGCSGYGTADFPAYQGNPDMHAVHKYMSLDTNEIGWFITNVGKSAASFGVAHDDVEAVGSLLMQTFGYSCSPPRDIGFGPQLNSICNNQACQPDANAQCSSYDDGGVEPKPEVAPQCQSASSTTMTMSTSMTSAKPTWTNGSGSTTANPTANPTWNDWEAQPTGPAPEPEPAQSTWSNWQSEPTTEPAQSSWDNWQAEPTPEPAVDPPQRGQCPMKRH